MSPTQPPAGVGVTVMAARAKWRVANNAANTAGQIAANAAGLANKGANVVANDAAATASVAQLPVSGSVPQAGASASEPTALTGLSRWRLSWPWSRRQSRPFASGQAASSGYMTDGGHADARAAAERR